MTHASPQLLGFVPKGPQLDANDRRTGIGELVHRLEASQWRSPEEIADRQFAALGRLVEHAATQSRFFADHLRAAGLAPADLRHQEGLLSLPPITRRDFQRAPDEVFCDQAPPEYGEVAMAASSGSTGEPVVIRRTLFDQLLFQAMTMRVHLWHGLGTGLRLCTSRATIPEIVTTPSWNNTAGQFWPTGAMLAIPNSTAIAKQTELIAAFAPDILVIYPSNIVAITQQLEPLGAPPFRLKQIRTTSETLSPHDRAMIEAYWQCPVIDIYSSTEVGYIAVQCPDSALYHVMSETLLVEIIDDRGRPCSEGEVGRIVISDLNNYATPVIRYAIGDLAEVGPPCACGRGMPTLKRIVGRERNLILMPDGTRHWPLTGRSRYRSVAPVVQYQMIQQERERIEVRLVVERPLDLDEEARLRTVMTEALGHPFALEFTYFEGRLPIGANGKLEEFVCRL